MRQILVPCLLIAGFVSLTAQENTAPPAGREPLATIIEREAARLASSAQAGNLPQENWSPVTALPAGTEVILTTKESAPAQRYVVHPDESGITALILPAVSDAARHALVDTASRHPEYLTAGLAGGQFALGGNVRIEANGLFVEGQKVAPLEQVVVRVARADVVEIRTLEIRHRHGKPRAVLGAIGGYFVGGIVGAFHGMAVDCAIGGCSDNIPNGLVVGLFAGAATGAVGGGMLLYRLSKYQTEHVIYRAP